MHEPINFLRKKKKKKKSCLTIVSALQMVPLFLRMTRRQKFALKHPFFLTLTLDLFEQ